MISATFARPNGLFIAQFKWKRESCEKAVRFYQLSIFVICAVNDVAYHL